MARKIGDKVMLTPKALKERPDLRGAVGTIVYRPVMTYPKGAKRGRIMHSVKFNEGNYPRWFGVFADQIQSVRK